MVRSLAKPAVAMMIIGAVGLPVGAGAQAVAKETGSATARPAEKKAGGTPGKRASPARDSRTSAQRATPPKSFGEQLKRDFRGAGEQIRRDWNGLKELF